MFGYVDVVVPETTSQTSWKQKCEDLEVKSVRVSDVPFRKLLGSSKHASGKLLEVKESPAPGTSR